MVNLKTRVLCLLALLLLGAGACASNVSPTVAPTPFPSPLVTRAASQSVSTPTAGEIEWDETVRTAKREGNLVIYSFFLSGDVGRAVSQAFEGKTGIKLEIVTSPNFTERLKTERRGGLRVASVLEGGSVTLQDAKLEGLTQPIGNLPTLAEKGVWRRDPLVDKESHILSLAQGTVNPWINTSLIKAGTEPKSWKDFLQPTWKGKIAMADPSVNTQPNRIFQPLLRAGRLDEAYFRQLGKQELQWQPTIRHEAESLAKGQVYLVFAGSLSALAPYITERLPIKAVDMEEGVVTYIMGAITLLDKAPQSNSAKLYVNWFMSREGQYIFQQANLTYSVRNDVPNFEPPQAQLTPKNPVEMTVEDMIAAGRVQREGTLKKLILGN